MRTSQMQGPACREIRQLLGVYVVGAIDPAERVIVDDHLTQCAPCRDELAGLAGLPAMLSRVPAADVERLAAGPADQPELTPPPQLLGSLLRKVAVRRRRRLWRGVVAAAAAAAIAAGSVTAAAELGGRSARSGQVQVASAASGIAAVVDYSPTPWGATAMRIRVTGVSPGTTCQFWVIGDGRRVLAGSWTVEPDYGRPVWYAAAARLAPDEVQGFQLSSAGQVLLRIPAA